MKTSMTFAERQALNAAKAARKPRAPKLQAAAPLPKVEPVSCERDDWDLVATYPEGTKPNQIGELGADYQRKIQYDGQRWILKSYEGNVARFWSPDLRPAK